MDENATCDRTLAVQDCLDNEGIKRLVWPARSPDLNPIENVWDALGRQVAARNYPPKNKNTLTRALTEEWDKLPQQLLDNVVQSMVRRVECCITLHGTLYIPDGLLLSLHLTVITTLKEGAPDSLRNTEVSGCHYPGMTTERVGLVSSQTKQGEVYSQKVMSGGKSKAGSSFGSLQMPWDRTHNGQGCQCMGLSCSLLF
ncbi:transposable element Tc1 transposase [Trichonephila clavipes]|nr:transposable element Tc1 transposase [Trichonephila clavipes]